MAPSSWLNADAEMMSPSPYGSPPGVVPPSAGIRTGNVERGREIGGARRWQAVGQAGTDGAEEVGVGPEVDRVRALVDEGEGRIEVRVHGFADRTRDRDLGKRCLDCVGDG